MNAKTILIVEDEASIAEVVSLYLKRAGFNVQIAPNGKKAMSLIEREQPEDNGGGEDGSEGGGTDDEASTEQESSSDGGAVH